MNCEKNEIINVLITGAGGADTPLVIESLKRSRQHFRIILCDIKPVPGIEGLADKFYRVPMGHDPDFAEEVLEIADQEKIDAMVPGVDEELVPMVSLREKRPDIQVILPDAQFVCQALNKYEMNRQMKKLGIPVPETFRLEELSAVKDAFFDNGIVLKPVRSHGSRGLYYLRNRDEAEKIAPYLRLVQPESVLQERIQGTEYTVSVLVTKDGRLLDIVPKKVLLKRGITLDAVTEREPHVIRYCEDIVQKMNPRGPFNVQLMLRGAEPYAFEINPRFSTTTVLTSEAGLEEVPISILSALNRPYEVKPWSEGVRLRRRWENLIERK